MSEKYSKSMFILFPALAMLLGWGLRGHIGGGPFGAMIPGAMVALSLSLLLELPAATTSIIVVFGVVGVGLGGEMTYGQTLSFLRNPETVMWGTLATTLKGSIWGVLGGAVLALGFIYKRLTKKTIIVALLLMMVGILLGFKLINQPMLIYFSDPANPRSESWGALLLGAVALLLYLKFKISKADFKLVSRFALWSLIGGALGFGIGGLWFVLGSYLPKEIVFQSWWKMMEFTFGFLLGAGLGYAAWLSRNELKTESDNNTKSEVYSFQSSYKEIGIAVLAGLLIFLVVPGILEPFVEAASSSDGIFMTGLRTISMMLVNYAFFGFILIIAAMYFPKAAWQLGITLTFCHTVIDLADDHIVEVFTNAPVLASILVVLIPTFLVAFLTAFYQRKANPIRSIFLLLIWSTVLVSMIKIGFYPQKLNLAGYSFCKIICGVYIVDIVFAVSAILLSLILIRKFKAV
ncbi:MAG: hypothetical protein HN778_13975 [Prolixibacteraceae bacterium]|nr:hypothetical protein [Prolixibacteraceae bacterium]MBT7000487.1 hypothetical protein [Prolixibacteraceae bacterium]MBT7395935.1 hypothetical protein [Prolixibacteraceae bacterium]